MLFDAENCLTKLVVHNWLTHCFCHFLLQRIMLQPPVVATKVLCLTEVVTVEELKNDEDYEDIVEDMKTECGKFGNCFNLVLPISLN